MELLNILVKSVDTAVPYAVDTGGSSIDVSGCQTAAVQAICTVSSGTKGFTTASVNTTTNAITITAHGFLTGLGVVPTATAGTLPAPLVSGTTYYVIKVDADTIKLATSVVNALAGTAVDLTTVGVTGPFVLTVETANVDVILQQSIDGTNWFDLDTENVVAATNILFGVTNPTGRYLRLYVDITTGQITITSSVLGKGIV